MISNQRSLLAGRCSIQGVLSLVGAWFVDQCLYAYTVHVYMCVCVYMCICVYVSVCVCMCVYTVWIWKMLTLFIVDWWHDKSRSIHTKWSWERRQSNEANYQAEKLGAQSSTGMQLWLFWVFLMGKIWWNNIKYCISNGENEWKWWLIVFCTLFSDKPYSEGEVGKNGIIVLAARLSLC